jgi:hypothetical protein
VQSLPQMVSRGVRSSRVHCSADYNACLHSSA